MINRIVSILVRRLITNNLYLNFRSAREMEENKLPAPRIAAFFVILSDWLWRVCAQTQDKKALWSRGRQSKIIFRIVDPQKNGFANSLISHSLSSPPAAKTVFCLFFFFSGQFITDI